MTRTARGREVDMASLIAANEKTVTVGNTNTNVPGDVVSSNPEVLQKLSRSILRKTRNSTRTERQSTNYIKNIEHLKKTSKIVFPRKRI